jgi:hypothetical protein
MKINRIAGGNSGNRKDVSPSTIEDSDQQIPESDFIVPSVYNDARINKRKLKILRDKKKEQLKKVHELSASSSWYNKHKADQQLTRKASEMDWKNVDSSFIQAVAYEDDLRAFHIKLKGGKEFSYKQVPRKVYDNLLTAESKGRVFNEIKRNYELY